MGVRDWTGDRVLYGMGLGAGAREAGWVAGGSGEWHAGRS